MQFVLNAMHAVPDAVAYLVSELLEGGSDRATGILDALLGIVRLGADVGVGSNARRRGAQQAQDCQHRNF